MNEEIQNSQINNQNSEESKSQAFPAWAVIIVFLLVFIVAIGIYFIFIKPKSVTAPIQLITQEQEKNVQPEIQVPDTSKANNQIEADITNQSAITNNIDVDYELKKMDESIGSVNDSDLNSGGLSNAEIGL